MSFTGNVDDTGDHHVKHNNVLGKPNIAFFSHVESTFKEKENMKGDRDRVGGGDCNQRTNVL